MPTNITVPGGSGHPPVVFQVSGISSTNYALQFQAALDKAQAAGTYAVNVLSNPASPVLTGGTVVNEIFGNSSSEAYTLTTGGEYALIEAASPTTVTGATAGGDTVEAAGSTVYDAVGNNDNVAFFAGDNTYNGGASTGDTISGGIGYDTINAGTGTSTVFSGSGHTLINLNDSGTGAGTVYLGDGTSTVNADGANDFVATGATGQTIFGGDSVKGQLTVVIGSHASAPGGSGDVVVAGSATTTVFDSVGGTSIFGGTGDLRFVGAAATSGGTISDSIVGGSGGTVVFGATGDSITFSDSTGSVDNVIAGLGNETLNAANVTGRVNYFGDTTDSASGAYNTQVIGSTNGYNVFNTGSGNESILGGNGTNYFYVADTGPNTHITIFDFANGSDSVNFGGLSQSDENTLLSNASVGSINNSDGTSTPTLTVTFADKATVEFVGITSLNGHVI